MAVRSLKRLRGTTQAISGTRVSMEALKDFGG
jgi:hypothetical protein